MDGTDGTLSSSISSRYPTNHPLTPESPIEEENCDDYVHWNGPSGLGGWLLFSVYRVPVVVTAVFKNCTFIPFIVLKLTLNFLR